MREREEERDRVVYLVRASSTVLLNSKLLARAARATHARALLTSAG